MVDSDTESDINSCDLNYRSLDDFFAAASSKDTNVRLDVYARLEDYLTNENTCLKCHNIDKFCDSILQWVHSSNYRISINGLTLIQLLIQRQTNELRNHSAESIALIIKEYIHKIIDQLLFF